MRLIWPVNLTHRDSRQHNCPGTSTLHLTDPLATWRTLPNSSFNSPNPLLRH